jgi:iron complex outermembrane recepter protein
MITRKLAFAATTALMGNALLAGAAFAQSTGSETMDVVIVTGSTGPATVSGIAAETVAKNRTTVTDELIATQQVGQTILQTLSVVTPGLNFTNNDPYGSSGGNIRLHGFDGNRIALTFDGMPLNDTGNYAVFTNQLLDPELISRAQVNTGSTDVDSPTAASTGGTINFSSRNPGNEPGGFVTAGIGDFAFKRYMGFAETGVFGPWGTSAWGAVSWQQYDKFKGAGNLQKTQFNAKVYQPIGDGDSFVSAAFHFNRNRNNSYYSPSLATVDANGQVVTPEETETDPFGFEVDFRTRYRPDTVTTRTGFAGDIDVAENTENGAVRGYYGLRINPSNTGNIRVQSRFDFGERFTLTVDPSFQYVLANGGTQNTVIWESCNGSAPQNLAASCPTLTRQLLGQLAPSATAGVDINGDGDINDLVRVMNPSTTNTYRYGLLSSLIFRITDDQLLRVGYTIDYGQHRQTGEFSLIDPRTLTYVSEFGGKRTLGPYVFGGQGSIGPIIKTADNRGFVRARDRFSIAELRQVSAEYRGNFFDDALSVNLGVRLPEFNRELNQNCFTQVGTSNVRCTTETPNATLPNGNVTFTGATTQFIAPFERDLSFDDVLPNVGASWRAGDWQYYGSYAESTSLPRTDNLYTVFRLANGTIGNPDVQPETSQTFEGGVRYDTSGLIASASLWSTKFENRIVSSFDEALAIFVDRNIGSVEQWGVDASVGWQPFDQLAYYGTISYNDSEVQENIRVSATGANGGFALTKGKSLVETPDWTLSSRLEYEPIPDLTFGAQFKYVGERWVTDVNDLKVDAYTVTDLDLRWKLTQFGLDGTSVRMNLTNLFDKDYYGSIGSQTSATVGAVGFNRPFASVGAPRTFTVSLRQDF